MFLSAETPEIPSKYWKYKKGILHVLGEFFIAQFNMVLSTVMNIFTTKSPIFSLQDLFLCIQNQRKILLYYAMNLILHFFL